MALEVLKGKTLPDHVGIDHDRNVISFKLQNGPVKEVGGVNGCQVDDMIQVTHDLIRELNGRFPDAHNEQAMHQLRLAKKSLDNRRKDRQKRGVEGHNVR